MPTCSPRGTRGPSAKTASKLPTNLASPSRTKSFAWAVVHNRHGQVAGLLGHPFAGGVRAHPAKPHLPTLEFDEEQHVHSSECDRLNREEVARQDPGGLGAKELGPTGTAPPRGGSQTMSSGGCCAPRWLIPASRAWRTHHRSAGIPKEGSPVPAARPARQRQDRGASGHGAHERGSIDVTRTPDASARAWPA
jgi:hypothetical protein